MMSNVDYKIKTLPEAIEDLKEAKEWYKSQSKTAFKKFLLAYEKSSHSLAKQPNRTNKRNTYQILLIPKFPYIIFYTVQEAIKTVIIVSVFNTNRDTNRYPQKAV